MSDDLHAVFNRDPDQDPHAPLLVMLHGFGADERDLMGLADSLPEEFVIASVRAPLTQPPGYSWYPLYEDAAFDEAVITSVTQQLVAMIGRWAHGRPSVTLLGFSQGMSMATAVVRAMPEAITAVVGLSGFVLPNDLEIFQDAQLKERPFKLFWGRDPQDPVINPQMIDASAQWLLEHADTTKVQYQNMGHSISPQEVRHVDEYLRAVVLG